MRRPVAALSFFPLPPATQLYTLSLHDALPISFASPARAQTGVGVVDEDALADKYVAYKKALDDIDVKAKDIRSEEHTSELQSPYDLVCRLLLEKKNTCAAHEPRETDCYLRLRG